MKIELHNHMNYYTSYSDVKRKSAQASVSRQAAKNFDGITIQSDQEVSPEQAFASTLASRLSLEVKKPVPQARIQDLQQQVQQGTYQVDVNAIADKIMLY